MSKKKDTPKKASMKTPPLDAPIVKTEQPW